MEISLKTKYLMTEICINNKSMANQEIWAGGRHAEGCTFSSFQCILSVRANLLKCLVIQLVQQVNSIFIQGSGCSNSIHSHHYSSTSCTDSLIKFACSQWVRQVMVGGHPGMLTIVLFCLRRVSLFSPGGPRTCYVAQMVPELRDSPVWMMMVLKAYTTMTYRNNQLWALKLNLIFILIRLYLNWYDFSMCAWGK